MSSLWLFLWFDATIPWIMWLVPEPCAKWWCILVCVLATHNRPRRFHDGSGEGIHPRFVEYWQKEASMYQFNRFHLEKVSKLQTPKSYRCDQQYGWWSRNDVELWDRNMSPSEQRWLTVEWVLDIIVFVMCRIGATVISSSKFSTKRSVLWVCKNRIMNRIAWNDYCVMYIRDLLI